MEIQINQESELPKAAMAILKIAGDEKIFLFAGEMGAGKTTLIKAICFSLGMEDMVSSPTYSIVNEYIYPGGKIYHFDFFRIKSQSEALDIGFEEYLSSGDFCFIEWPENISDLWPEHFIEIKIVENESGERIIRATKV